MVTHEPSEMYPWPTGLLTHLDQFEICGIESTTCIKYAYLLLESDIHCDRIPRMAHTRRPSGYSSADKEGTAPDQ